MLKRGLGIRWIGVALLLCILSFGQAQVVINEIRSDGGSAFTVELKNVGITTVNVSTYFLCHQPSYSLISTLDVECGSTNMAPGSILSLSGFTGGTAADGEMGLYSAGDFGNPASIRDYVEWGSPNHSRANVAQSAGIWTVGDFVPGFAEFGSIEYTGVGDTSTSWENEELVPTICAENIPGSNCIVGSGTASTSDPTMVCSGDGQPDEVTVTVSGATGNNRQFVVTDTNGVITDIVASMPIDFEGSDAGVCQVWEVIYNGVITNLAIDSNLSDLGGCLAISGPVTITKTFINGGVISTLDSTIICAGDGISDSIDVTLADTIGSNSAWLITDLSGQILSLPAGPSFDLDSAGPGMCQIWHLSYEDGLTGLTVGSNISGLMGCFDLSNPIEVDRRTPEGGTITALTDTNICRNSSGVDAVLTELNGASGSNSSWVVADTNGAILVIQTTQTFNLDLGTETVFQILHVSYEDGLSGLTIGGNITSVSGCFDWSNSILISRQTVIGGNLSTVDSTIICAGDGLTDSISVVLTDTLGTNSAWLITDTMGVILELPEGPPFDLESYPPGFCQIWHVSFEDGLTGLMAGNPVGALSGCFDLSNPITIEKRATEGGMISTNADTIICYLDETIDTVLFAVTGEVGSNGQWLMTDTSGIIIAIQDSPEFVFDTGQHLICRVWHISFEDGLTGLTPGADVASLQGCFALSNPISIYKGNPNAGVLSTVDQTTFCLSDGVADTVRITVTGEDAFEYTYIRVNGAGVILEVSADGEFFITANNPVLWAIFGVAHDADIDGLQVGGTTVGLSGCYRISTPIFIRVNDPQGGSISTTDPTSVCAGDGMEDPVNITLTGSSGGQSDWVFTDTSGIIQQIVTFIPTLDLETQDGGVFDLYRLSYETGLMGLEQGIALDSLDGCFSLSNSIRLTINEVDGGTIVPHIAPSFCVDGIADTILVDLNDAAGDSAVFLVTDTSGMVLTLQSDNSFVFEGTGSGTFVIWHLAINDGISGLAIDSNVSQLSGCYDLSNPIQVVQADAPQAGVISTADSTFLCLIDGDSDIVNVAVEGVQGSNTAWLFTDEDGLIVQIPNSPPFDFGTSADGIYSIWHIVYEGELSGLENNEPIGELDGCFALSNALEITVSEPIGGVISTMDDTLICVSDDLSDNIIFDVTGSQGAQQTLVITTEDLTILDLVVGNTYDFDDLEPGTCQVWNLSHGRDLALENIVVGGNLYLDLPGCYDASPEPVTITKASSGLVCEGVGIQDQLQFIRAEIFPNPVRGEMRFAVELVKPTVTMAVSVFNVIGKRFYHEREILNGSLVERNLDLRQLPAGHYTLHFQTDNGSLAMPFVKF